MLKLRKCQVVIYSAILLAALLVAPGTFSQKAYADDALSLQAGVPTFEGDSENESDTLEAQANMGLAPYTVTAEQKQKDARSILPKVNLLRKAEGASELVWDDDLEKAAIQRAAECAVMFSHTRPSGQSCFTVCDKASGENIGMCYGFADVPGQVFDQWVNSPGHHANMVDKGFKSIGIGGVYVNDNGRIGYYYVQLFSREAGSGMNGSAAAGNEDFTVYVPTMAVKSISVASPVYLGVGAVESLPDVKLTYQSLSTDSGIMYLHGTQAQPNKYFRWKLDSSDVAAFVEGNTLMTGRKKGSTPAYVTLSDYSKSAKFTIEVTNWARLWGNDAYGTMRAIVRSAFADGKCDTVVLATFDGYWDALTASGLAGACKCPVLMTGSDSLNDTTKSEIERLGASKVVIAGGPKAVSKSVESKVRQIPGVKTVVRAQGADAAGTACKIYDLAISEGHAWSETAFVATADGYWDALAASPLAYHLNCPVFLASAGNKAKKLDSATLSKLKTGGFKSIVICGGPAAVSKDVEKQLASIGLSGSSVVRKAGDTAAETSAEIAKYGVSKGMTDQSVAVATLDGYWDSLSGAALCGSYGIPLVLVNDENRNAISAFIKPNASKMERGVVFGGTAAVSEKTYLELIKIF